MRVIAPAALATIAPERRTARALKIEMLGLAASSLVILLGMVLTYSAKVGRENASDERTIGLHVLRGPADLEPALDMFSSRFERQAVARALYRRATASSPPIEHVGALAWVTIPAAEIRADRRFVELRSRLDRRPDLQELAVLSPSDLSAIKPQLVVRDRSAATARLGRALASFLGAFWIAHLYRRWRRADDDPVLLPILMLLCGIGLMAMLALRDPLRDTMTAAVFAGGVVAGVAALLAASEMDFEASRLRRAVLLPLGIALALAAMLLAFGSGPGSSGVKVNLFGFQPVEAIRLLVVLALAAYFGRRIEFLRELSEPPTPSRPWLRYLRMPRWKDVRPVFVSMALVLAFFFLQKDLGPALVLSCVFLALYGIGRGHAAFVVTGFALLLAGFTLAYWIGTPATVRQRVMIWADPWNNGVPGGNHIAHGLWALSTGAFWGSGPGLGGAQVIPAAHTDFVLAALGEELGFMGLAAVVALYALLGWRCLRAALRAPGDYSAFLAAGVALALVVQALVIASGLLGLVPLSGVVTPFLSYGRSSMLANCVAVGIVLAVARRRTDVREHLRQPIRVLGAILAAAGAAVAVRAAWIQVVHADDVAAASSLTEQADGGYRFEHNPRLLSAARLIVRGTIYDRNGLPLATSRPDQIAAVEATYRAAGVTAPQACAPGVTRCYPLGGLAFHVVGDWNHQTNWAARNSSYIERDSDAYLKGYDDRSRTVEVINPRTGRREQAVARDFRELLPLVRSRYRPGSAAVQALLTRDRDVRTSLDARLQIRAASAVRDRVESGGAAHGAAIVLDARTGEVLASVSYPWPVADDLDPRGPVAARSEAGERLLDRSRYGLYPPGSVFKLVVAGAALRSDAEEHAFACVRLPGGRVGTYVHGSPRPVRDDPMDTVPHGTVNLHRGLVVSCNAYFAQLGVRLGPRPLLDAASVFQIDPARTATAAGLAPTLAHAAYGQGQVVVSPLKMARVAASIASGGAAPAVHWLATPPAPKVERVTFLSATDAARLGRAMRDVVTSGTGRSVRSNATPIAGKTGTAETNDGAAHSWFAGFAPYGVGGRRIAFAAIVENAGYGARAAAPLAGEIVTAARELGLIR